MINSFSCLPFVYLYDVTTETTVNHGDMSLCCTCSSHRRCNSRMVRSAALSAHHQLRFNIFYCLSSQAGEPLSIYWRPLAFYCPQAVGQHLLLRPLALPMCFVKLWSPPSSTSLPSPKTAGAHADPSCLCPLESLLLSSSTTPFKLFNKWSSRLLFMNLYRICDTEIRLQLKPNHLYGSCQFGINCF